MPIISGGGGGGGYTPPTGRQWVFGNAVNIANGGNARLTWNTSPGPTVLLDRSTLDIPSVLTAGIYAFSANVTCGAMTAGGSFQASLELDSDAFDAVVTADSAPASVAIPAPSLTLSLTLYIPAAGTIRLTVRNHDGANAVNFALQSAQVQQIT